jgi:hypothetical protein
VLIRKLVVVAVAGMWVGPLATVAAAAGEPLEYPTFIAGEVASYMISASGDVHYRKFGGQIGSPASECVPDRKVSLYRKRHGDKKKLGSDTTDAVGEWKIKVSSTNGKYSYKVKQKEIAPVGTGEARVCLGLKFSSKVDE